MRRHLSLNEGDGICDILPKEKARVCPYMNMILLISSVRFSCLVMSDSLWTHGLQNARPPCPLPTPRVYPNPCPLSQWCHPTISVVPISYCLQSFPALGVFSNDLILCIRWPKYWSFSFNIRPSNEYSGLISCTMDWLDLLAVQEISRIFSSTTVQKHQFFGTQLFYSSILISIHDYCKNHSLD